MQSIQTKLEGASRYLAENPEAGVGVDSAATAVLEQGLRVRVGEVTTDMPETVGGGAEAPTPGWLLRAALAACDATAVAMEAARRGVELTRVEVTVESDSDSRGLHGIGDAQPGPTAVRTHIRVEAENASKEELKEIAERAEAKSPVGDAIARAIPMTLELSTKH